jgi:uncharacterized protein (UPF0276 family)
VYPLFEQEKAEAIEWSFDALFRFKEIPTWFDDLLHAYSNEKRLLGHGVFFSLFSGKWSQDQKDWLKVLKETSKKFPFDHVTEHFGFLTGKDFHEGAPLPVPYSSSTLKIGQDRLKRIYDACECPVGLENLAFSYSLEEVKHHGDFLYELIKPVNGFIILDLHNIYCQMHNFSVSSEELLKLYPLHKVREFHISGGSWVNSATDPNRKIRRDTHDDSVPDEVFKLLEYAADKCPECKYVVMEQLGNGLRSPESKQLFYDDFIRMESIVADINKKRLDTSSNDFLPAEMFQLDYIPEDEHLYNQQMELSDILENAPTYEDAMLTLNRSSLTNSSWQIEKWQPYMVETAMQLAKKWKKK